MTTLKHLKEMTHQVLGTDKSLHPIIRHSSSASGMTGTHFTLGVKPGEERSELHDKKFSSVPAALAHSASVLGR